jgi:epoxyqueuosine reductase QueG
LERSLVKPVINYLHMKYAEENTTKVRELFQRSAEEVELRGILGITSYRQVFDTLVYAQKKRLNELVESKHSQLMLDGNIISFAYVYPDGVIDNIGNMKDGVFDKQSWNIYADWYTYLNNSLDATSKKMAKTFNGIPITATTTGMASKINHVSEYFPTVVSHRVHAENAGIGWRGKNSLIVNPRYSCMIRLSGVITETPLIKTNKPLEDCGDCTSCEEACTYLMNRDKLEDYREQCRVYLDNLGLHEEVCGKCIKACVHSPRLTKPSTEPKDQRLNQVYYTQLFD